MNMEWQVLRILHVLGGVIWAGTAIFLSFFLIPALGDVGPAGGQVMGALVKRRVFVIIPTIAVIVMIAGLRMMWISSDGFSMAYFGTWLGAAYLTGTVLSVSTLTLFFTVNRPAITLMMKLGAKLAAAPDAEKGAIAAEMAAVRARAAMGSRAAALLMGTTAVLMALARYL